MCLRVLPKRWPGWFGNLSLALVVFATPVGASEPRLSKSFVIICAARTTDFKDLTSRVIAADRNASTADLLQTLDNGKTPSVLALEQLTGPNRRRLAALKGERLDVYVIASEPYDLDVDEKYRDTQFGIDIARLTKYLAGAGSEGTVETKVQRHSYTLARIRSTFAVRYTSKPDIPPSSTPPSDPASTAGAATRSGPSFATGKQAVRDTLKADFITGPSEHFFLTAGVRLNSIEELKYNESNNAFEPKNKPENALLGFNYVVGDLLADRRPSLLEGIALGVVCELSSHPGSTLGAIASYRFTRFTFLGLDLDALSPFGGIVRAKDDVRKADGTVEFDGKYRIVSIWGINLNVDRVLSWSKK